MFHVSDEVRRLAERIQHNAFSRINADPAEVARHNAEHHTPDSSDKELEERHASMTMADFYSMMPEHHYDTSLEYFRFCHDCTVTPYDRAPFLARFANIIPLCHELYTSGNPALRRNIVVTSLPFLNLNGVCIRHDETTDVVFLNQGLLSVLPMIYRFLLPLCNPQLFGTGAENNNLNNIFNILTEACFFKDGYNTLKNERDFEYPHADEKWHVMHRLQQQLERRSQKPANSHEATGIEHPSTYPFTQKMAHFLACRGAFVYILGHEFSHAYCNHSQYAQAESASLRNAEILEGLEKEFAAELGQYPEFSARNAHFCVHQPIEEEADAHGLLCVFKYCEDNRLDDQRTVCVLTGALAAFLVMEIHECFTTVHALGAGPAQEFLTLNPFVRNMLFREEHPVPITRLSMALNHDTFKDSPGLELLGQFNGELIQVWQALYQSIAANFTEMEKIVRSAEMLDVDMEALFAGHCLGANDLSQAYFSKLRPLFQAK